MINQVISLKERHIQAVPEITQRGHSLWVSGFARVAELFPPHHIQHMTPDQCVAQTSPHRRVRARNAMDFVAKWGWDDIFARGKMFGKWEKHDDADLALELKSMRAIQHRGDAYCYTLARYLKPVEMCTLYARSEGRRWFVKGMSPHKRADLLASIAASFQHPVFVGLDHSRYDAHLVKGIRQYEWDFYRSFYPNNAFLSNLLRLQEDNVFTSSRGIRYKMSGTMCSGDYNTSLGDNLINLAALSMYARRTRHHMMVDGDDSILVVDASELDLLDPTAFVDMGLTTKIEYLYDISEVSFCQCKYVRTGAGPVMVRDPARVISRSSYTDKTYPNRSTYVRLLRAIGECEFSSNRGVPVLQSFADLLLRSSEGSTAIAAERDFWLRVRGVRLNLQPIPITLEARLDFSVAFGVNPTEQVGWETFFASHVVAVTPEVESSILAA